VAPPSEMLRRSDVYAGHDGHVYKKSDDGSWQENSGSGREPSSPYHPSTPRPHRRVPPVLAAPAEHPVRSGDNRARAQQPGSAQAERSQGRGSPFSTETRSQLKGDSSARARSESRGSTNYAQSGRLRSAEAEKHRVAAVAGGRR